MVVKPDFKARKQQNNELITQTLSAALSDAEHPERGFAKYKSFTRSNLAVVCSCDVELHPLPRIVLTFKLILA